MPALTHGRAARDYKPDGTGKGKNGPPVKKNSGVPNRIRRTRFFGISHGKFAKISSVGSRNRFTRAAINRRTCCALDPEAGTTTPIGGARVDGYIAGSTGQVIDLKTGDVIFVFVTDSKGEYSITLVDMPDFIKINFLADGVDISTGKSVNRSSSSVVIKPPIGEDMPPVIASPLTTMVAKLVEKSITDSGGVDLSKIKAQKQEAKAKTAKIFNIDPDDLEKDFIKEGNTDIAKAAISVATCISTLTTSAKKGGVTTINDDDMFSAFVNTIATKNLNELGGASGFKLTDSSSMGTIVKNAAVNKGVALSTAVISNIGSSVSNAATSIANAEGNDFNDIMKDMTRRKEKSKAAIEDIEDITNFTPPAAVKKIAYMSDSEKSALNAIKVSTIVPVVITNPPIAVNDTYELNEGGEIDINFKVKNGTGPFTFYLLNPPPLNSTLVTKEVVFEYTVTVVNSKFKISHNGVELTSLSFRKGYTYKFNQNDNAHPLVISTSDDRSITGNYKSTDDGNTRIFKPTYEYTKVYLYCKTHADMGSIYNGGDDADDTGIIVYDNKLNANNIELITDANNDNQSETLTFKLNDNNNFHGIKQLKFNVWDNGENKQIFTNTGLITLNISNVQDIPTIDGTDNDMTVDTLNKDEDIPFTIDLAGYDVDNAYGTINDIITYKITHINDMSIATLKGYKSNNVLSNISVGDILVNKQITIIPHSPNNPSSTYYFKYKVMDNKNGISAGEGRYNININEINDKPIINGVINGLFDLGHDNTKVGSTLKGPDITNWTTFKIVDNDGLPDNNNNIVYTWWKTTNITSNPVLIPDENNNEYKLKFNDKGYYIQLKIVYTDKNGHSETIYSKYTDKVIPNMIDGVEVIEYHYQWYRNDVAIDGATNEHYFITSEDEGQNIKVKVINDNTKVMEQTALTHSIGANYEWYRAETANGEGVRIKQDIVNHSVYDDKNIIKTNWGNTDEIGFDIYSATIDAYTNGGGTQTLGGNVYNWPSHEFSGQVATPAANLFNVNGDSSFDLTIHANHNNPYQVPDEPNKIKNSKFVNNEDIRVWATEDNDGLPESYDGGFQIKYTTPDDLDLNENYIYLCFVKRTVEGNNDGTYYFGPTHAGSGLTIINTTGGTSTSYYFHATQSKWLPLNKWCLAIGFVFKKGTPSNRGVPNIQGVWNIETGEQLYGQQGSDAIHKASVNAHFNTFAFNDNVNSIGLNNILMYDEVPGGTEAVRVQATIDRTESTNLEWYKPGIFKLSDFGYTNDDVPQSLTNIWNIATTTLYQSNGTSLLRGGVASANNFISNKYKLMHTDIDKYIILVVKNTNDDDEKYVTKSAITN